MEPLDKLLAILESEILAKNDLLTAKVLPQEMAISKELASDPMVKRVCKLEGLRGDFLGIRVLVVPDVKIKWANEG